jgi:hypothetical protein
MNRRETQGDGGKTAVSGPSSGPQKEVRPRFGSLFHELGGGWGIFPPQPLSLDAAERVEPINIDHHEQQCLGAMGLIYPFAFPRRPYQMWCISYTKPPQHPFH